MIKSALAQTSKEWNLYIMDNSSPDVLPKMRKVYEKYEHDPRIIVDYTEVPTYIMRVVFDMVAYVTNKAIFDLGGTEDYITFTANDVVLHPDKIKNIIHIFDSHPNENIICCGAGRNFPPNKSASCQLDWTHFMGTRRLMKQLGRICEFRGECPSWWWAPDAWLWTMIANQGHTVTNYNFPADTRHPTPKPKDQDFWDKWKRIPVDEKIQLGLDYIDTYLRKEIVVIPEDEKTLNYYKYLWENIWTRKSKGK